MDPIRRSQLTDGRLTSHSARYSGQQRRMISSGRRTQSQSEVHSSSTQSQVRAKFSYGAQLISPPPQRQDFTQPPLPSLNQPSAGPRTQNADWLAIATNELQQDLETTKQELDLVRDLQQELDKKLHQLQQTTSPEKPSRMLRDNRALIAACREYSDSRLQILKERLRQVQFWTASRDMGRKVPGKEPVEWLVADMDWRRWLNEQVAEKTVKADGEGGVPRSPIDDKQDAAWRLWGPLPMVLDCWSWLQMESKL